MPYTLWSRGRLIGHTDLGFVRVVSTARMGWFHPTVEGERVMPIAVAMPPVIQSYVDRARQLSGDATTVQAELDRSTEGADLSAAFNHLEALAFELRREDGSVVPTDSIGIQDTHRLLALAREWQLEDVDDWSDVDDMLVDDAVAQGDGFRDWAIGDIDDPFPRYQIYVELVDGAAIP